jgi:pimeloyl-ACP methyl ester carboxylesterase
LNWWRNVDRSWELMAAFDVAAVSVPALYVAGDRDFVVTVFQPFIAKQSMLVPKLRPTMILLGCGIWTQQERAAEVSAAMIDFLRQL